MPRLVGNTINPWFKRFELPADADIDYHERSVMQITELTTQLNSLLLALVKIKAFPERGVKTELHAFNYLCFLMRHGNTIGRICHSLPNELIRPYVLDPHAAQKFDELIRLHFPDEHFIRTFNELMLSCVHARQLSALNPSHLPDYETRKLNEIIRSRFPDEQSIQKLNELIRFHLLENLSIQELNNFIRSHFPDDQFIQKLKDLIRFQFPDNQSAQKFIEDRNDFRTYVRMKIEKRIQTQTSQPSSHLAYETVYTNMSKNDQARWLFTNLADAACKISCYPNLAISLVNFYEEQRDKIFKIKYGYFGRESYGENDYCGSAHVTELDIILQLQGEVRTHEYTPPRHKMFCSTGKHKTVSEPCLPFPA